MLIRDAQIKVFEESVFNNYIIELAEHCRDFSPHLSKTLSAEQLNAILRKGVLQAEDKGLTFRGPVRYYIDMTILFGSGFDTDPQYPWAKEILSKKDEINQMDLAEMLHDKTQTYLSKVNGKDNLYFLKALENISALQKVVFQPKNFEQEMLNILKQIYPQKFEEVGEPALRQLIAEGRKKGAEQYDFREARSLGFMAILMYAFGHQFDSDPWLPWISRTLSQKDQADPDFAAKELERRALIWVDAVLRNAREK